MCGSTMCSFLVEAVGGLNERDAQCQGGFLGAVWQYWVVASVLQREPSTTEFNFCSSRFSLTANDCLSSFPLIPEYVVIKTHEAKLKAEAFLGAPSREAISQVPVRF